MDKEAKLPDDLNDWSKEHFQEAINMFKKVVKKNKQNIDDAITMNHKTDEKVVEEKVANREVPIHDDDLLNLKIMLESSKSIDDFIKQM